MPLLPFKLNDASMGASAGESGSKNTYNAISQLHESAKRTPTVDLRGIPRIWQTYDADVT